MLSKMFDFIAQVKDSPAGLVSTDTKVSDPKTMIYTIDSAKRQ